MAIKVENISKRYRIGVKKEMHDSIGGAIFSFIKSPLKNYRKYRSLYKFDDINPDNNNSQFNNSSDIIWALRDVSFGVNRGEIVGIIGVNGAGKSTLLKILSRITDPTSGRIEIRGRISSLLEVGTGFHPELTGKDNVYLNGTILGMRKKEIDRKFDEIVNFSGIEKFIDTPVKRYSSGMRVRLAFAVAAFLEPEILLIDEVLAVGDIRFQKKCLTKMQDVREQGRTILFVSHNLPAVTRLCPRVILLNSGEVKEDGPSHEVVSAYITSGDNMKAQREWPILTEAPGDNVVRLASVRIRTEKGLISETVDIRQPVSLEMEYEVLKPGYVFCVSFHVMTEMGIEAFSPIDNDPEWRSCPRPIGRYVSKAWITGNFLSEGIHFVGASIRTLNPMLRHCSSYDQIAFQVIDSMDGDTARVDWGGKMTSVVRPLLKWETKFIPKADNPKDTFL